MYLILLYFLSIIIVAIILYRNNEGFVSSMNVSDTISNDNSVTSKEEPAVTVSNYADMTSIDLSKIFPEKFERDLQSVNLSNCISRFTRKDIKPLRDVSEMMFANKLKDNIFEFTEYDENKKFVNQLNYW